MRHYRAEYTQSRALVIALQAEEAAIALADILAKPPYLFDVTALVGAAAAHDAIFEVTNGIYQLDEDSRFLMAYAGPPLLREEKPALLPFDGDPEDSDSLIPLQKFLPSAMLRVKHTAFILDAAFPERALSLNGSRLSVDPALYPTRSASVMLSAGERIDYPLLPFVVEGLVAARIDPDTWTYNFHDLIRYVYLRGTQQAGAAHYPVYGHLSSSEGADFVLMYEAGAFADQPEAALDHPLDVSPPPPPPPAFKPTPLSPPIVRRSLPSQRPKPAPSPPDKPHLSIQRQHVINVADTRSKLDNAVRSTNPPWGWIAFVLILIVGVCPTMWNSLNYYDNLLTPAVPTNSPEPPTSRPAPAPPDFVNALVPERSALRPLEGPLDHSLRLWSNDFTSFDWYESRGEDLVAAATFDVVFDMPNRQWDIGFRVGVDEYAFYASSDETWRLIGYDGTEWQELDSGRMGGQHDLGRDGLDLTLIKLDGEITFFIEGQQAATLYIQPPNRRLYIAPAVGSPLSGERPSIIIEYRDFVVWRIFRSD